MKLSARNILSGKVLEVKKGATTAHVRLELPGGAALGRAAVAAGGRAQGRGEVRDAAGRTAALPARVGRVFPAGPPASILVWSVAPDLLAGWPGRPPRPAELAFMAREAAALPE